MGVQLTAEEWAEIVEDYMQSGLTQAKYAEQLGINAKTLANHLKKARQKNGRGVKKRNLNEWSRLIDEQVTSGIDRGAWCKEHNISPTAMRTAERRIQTTKSQPPTPTGFAQVELKNETTKPSSSMGRIYIRLSEVVIEADASYPTSNLASIIMEISKP